MKKAGVENLIITRHTKSKMGRGKQSATYLTSLCKRMSQRVRRKDRNRTKASLSATREGKVVERHEPSLPNGTRKKTKKYFFFLYI